MGLPPLSPSLCKHKPLRKPSKNAEENLAVYCVDRNMVLNSLNRISFLLPTAPSPLHPISLNSISSGSPAINFLVTRNPIPTPATYLVPGMLPQRRLSETRQGLYRPGNRRVCLCRLFLSLTVLNWVPAMPQVRPGGQKGESLLSSHCPIPELEIVLFPLWG